MIGAGHTGQKRAGVREPRNCFIGGFWELLVSWQAAKPHERYTHVGVRLTNFKGKIGFSLGGERERRVTIMLR